MSILLNDLRSFFFIFYNNNNITSQGQQQSREPMEHPELLISVDGVKELKEICLTDDGLVVGAAVTLSKLEIKLSEIVSTLSG